MVSIADELAASFASARRAKAAAAASRAGKAPAPSPQVSQPATAAALERHASVAALEADGIPSVVHLKDLTSRGIVLAPAWATKLVNADSSARPTTAEPAHAGALGLTGRKRGWVPGAPLPSRPTAKSHGLDLIGPLLFVRLGTCGVRQRLATAASFMTGP